MNSIGQEYQGRKVDGILIAQEYSPGTKLALDLPIINLFWKQHKLEGAVRAYNGLANFLDAKGYVKPTIKDAIECFDEMEARREFMHQKNFGKKSAQVLRKAFADAGYVLPEVLPF